MCSFLFRLGNRRLDWLAAINPVKKKANTDLWIGKESC
jgi:hypothetical protein